MSGIAVGDRVAVPWLGYACGQCRYCNDGRETLCARQLRTGYTIDGSYADYVLGYARHVVKVPDGVHPFDAAPLTCAGVTTYKAVKISGARPASLVAVVGVGGLGHLGVQYARIAGAEVIAVDVSDARLKTAEDLGADHLVHAGEQDVDGGVQRLGGADAVILTAASPKPIAQAYASLAPGGTMVFVGLPQRERDPIPIFQDGAERDHSARFDRRHAPGPDRGVPSCTGSVAPGCFGSSAPLERVNEAFTEVLEGSAATPRLVLAI